MRRTEESKPVLVNLKAPPIYRVIVIQFLVAVCTALIALALLGKIAGYSALLGGLVSTLPNAYFARKAFQYRGARNTPHIVKAFYAGQSGKMVLTAIMFALVFAGIKPLNELAVIVSFIITIFAGLIATAYVGLKQTRHTR